VRHGAGSGTKRYRGGLESLVAIFVSIPNANIIWSVAGLAIFGGYTVLDFNRLSCRANGSFSFPQTFPPPRELALRLALRGEGEGLETVMGHFGPSRVRIPPPPLAEPKPRD
jgi:hypothetical protein